MPETRSGSGLGVVWSLVRVQSPRPEPLQLAKNATSHPDPVTTRRYRLVIGYENLLPTSSILLRRESVRQSTPCYHRLVQAVHWHVLKEKSACAGV